MRAYRFDFAPRRRPRARSTKTVDFLAFEINRPFAQLLSGLETGHPAAAGPSPAYDFSVFDERNAVFLVSVLDCFGCFSSGLDHLSQVGALLVSESTLEEK